MPITVNVPEVGKVNFPDSMSPDEIQSAIEKDILHKTETTSTSASLQPFVATPPALEPRKPFEAAPFPTIAKPLPSTAEEARMSVYRGDLTPQEIKEAQEKFGIDPSVSAPYLPIPEIKPQDPKSVFDRSLAAAANKVRSMIESVESPAGATATIVGGGVPALGKGMAALFGLHSVVTETPEFIQAVKEGDVPRAAAAATGAAIGGVMTLPGAKGGFDFIKERLTPKTTQALQQTAPIQAETIPLEHTAVSSVKAAEREVLTGETAESLRMASGTGARTPQGGILATEEMIQQLPQGSPESLAINELTRSAETEMQRLVEQEGEAVRRTGQSLPQPTDIGAVPTGALPPTETLFRDPSGLKVAPTEPVPQSKGGLPTAEPTLDLLPPAKVEELALNELLRQGIERGPALQRVEALGDTIRRRGNWPRAEAERFVQQIGEGVEREAHPYKPLTANQLKLINDSLIRAIAQNRFSEERPGIIAGSRLEHWADRIIAEGRLLTGLDPELLSAYIVKGAAMLEKGITSLADWTTAMVKEFGNEIRPYLPMIRQQVERTRAATFSASQLTPSKEVQRASSIGTSTTVHGAVRSQPEPSKGQVPAKGSGNGVQSQGQQTSPTPQQEPPPSVTPPEGQTGEGVLGNDIYGIAQAVREQRAESGQTIPIEPGQGISAPESIARGRELIRQGTDPETVLAEFEKTKAFNADTIAVTRAHGERLALDSKQAEEQFGAGSPEQQTAWKSLADWDKRTKVIQTEWAKSGQAQQGFTDIDTGTFTGLQRAYHDATGKEFTPQQTREAVQIAEGVKSATEQAQESVGKLYQQLDSSLAKVKVPTPKTLDEAKELFAKQKLGKDITPEQVKTLWNAAKQFYLDKGITDFDDIRNGLATDFGLPVKDVTRALAQPKGVKPITNEMYSQITERRRLVESAKRWLKNTATPGWLRFLQNIPRMFFATKVFGHGTVAFGTHAPAMAFDVTAWKSYWPAFIKMYHMVGSPQFHEIQMADLVRDQNFVTAKRAGLANDPVKYQDDYQNPDIAKYFGRLSGMGNRGFDALKLLRQARFNQIWNALPETFKGENAKETARVVADAVNHSTGVVKMSMPKGAAIALFAPKLEASRWAFMVGDPIKAGKNFINWKNSTPQERLQAMGELKQKATIAGVYFSLLAMNQGILSAIGSKQKVNFTDPRHSDFLEFKVAGYKLGIGSAMLSSIRFLSDVYHITQGQRSPLEKLQSRGEEVGSRTYSYARGKLSPFASFGADMVTGADYAGRPLPFSKDKVPNWMQRRGLGRYTWLEYVTETALPIPFEEAVKEVWESQGMDKSQMETYFRAVTIGLVTGGTGARLSEDTRRK